MVTHPRRLSILEALQLAALSGFAVMLVFAAVTPGIARAEELAENRPSADESDSPWTRANLDLRGGLAAHDHNVTAAGRRNRAQGSAVTQLALGGAWLARRLPVGLAADLELERYSLTPSAGTGGGVVTGLSGSAGVVGRVPGTGALLIEGQLRYAYLQVPFGAVETSGITPASTTAALAASMTAHGPELAARLGVALAPFADLEARARAMPRSFGAQHGSDGAEVHRYAVGAGARLGNLDLGSLCWSALVGYELVLTTGEARDFELHQAQHRVGLGLRAAWPVPLPAVARAPLEPAPVVAAPKVGRVRGQVRAARASKGIAQGAPLAGVSVTVDDGATITTDVEGRFVVDGLPAALTKIALEREGFIADEEVVAVPANGEVTVEIELKPEGPPPAGVLLGFVRGEDGIPVSAAIRVAELQLSARADRRGRFRLEVPPGRYAVTIEAPGFETQTKAVVVGPGEQTIFNLDLQRHR